MADAAVYLVAAFFVALGLAALARPEQVPAGFGGTAPTPEARNEIRAVYGGFGLAVAAVLVWAAADASDAVREGVLVAVAVALAGMAGGRVVGAIAERPRGVYPIWFWFSVEVIGAAALFAAA
jgi:hypothetical protein